MTKLPQKLAAIFLLLVLFQVPTFAQSALERVRKSGELRIGTDATYPPLEYIEGGQFAGFEPSWRAALDFADAMTPTSGDVTDEIYAELARWWTPPQIIEITSVIGFFNYFNRFAEALRIPVTR